MKQRLSEMYWWWVMDVDTGIKDVLKLLSSIGLGIFGFYLAQEGYGVGYIAMLVSIPLVAIKMADTPR